MTLPNTPASTDKDYVVASSGHGSPFRFDKNTPEDSLKYTLDDAKIEKRRWEGYADTIGGLAIIIHLPSWKGDRSSLPFIKDNEDLYAKS